MIAVDTNLLVYAHRAATPEHRSARRALERASADGRGWGIPMPCLAEFWAVVTHPAASGRPSTPAEAAAFLRELEASGGAAIWLPTSGFGRRAILIAEKLGVCGARVFDLQIAVIAADAGATELWSHDTNFVVLPGLKLVDPIA
jgi:toxin-antitoxin system PIN domain toxin